MTTTTIELKPPPMPRELRELMKAVDKKNPSQADIDELRHYLKEKEGASIHLGNLANMVQDRTIRRMFSSAKSIEMSVYGYCVSLRRQLGYEGAPPLERLLIETCVLTWLRLYDTELYYEHMCKETLTLGQGEYWEKKLSAAQRRYLRALETLARVRRMNLVALQVNIGQNQQIITGGS